MRVRVPIQVKCVHYPGLPSHPRHKLVSELFSGRGTGGMLAFEVVDGPTADAVLQVSCSCCLWCVNPV